ncbi:Nap1p [Saccharomyces cerevisiae x Saccharomyces kudriavzevii VIN7]|uniref:Nap1p n=1 Tax=Saccharomyces cerevisiae x Saccharomyces kudriavzevii (strain VIN7) TaxID=1095631 RepID=H0GXQ5_SACCK|nr:Nap1p [Saccharomyces cerevisiae x Saccharomyces kudriavzevii VIN7]
MSDPIKTKPKSSMQIDNAPTPHNTPASVLNPSYLKNGNPVRAQAQEQDDKIGTINEEDILANQPLLLQSIQDRLGSLVGQDSGYVGALPKNVKEKLLILKTLQSELFEVEKEFQVEMFELENKFLQKYKPIWEHRSRIIAGEEQPTPELIAKGREIVSSLNETELLVDGEEDAGEEQAKGIPSFWLTALENLPIVCDTITDRDAEVLKHLLDIGLEYLTDGRPGFRLLFGFDSSANPFFTDETLYKTYYYQKELGYSGDFIYDHAEGCEINWKDNAHNVTVDLEMRKQRNKTTKQVRTIEKITPVESFFNFFDPPKIQSEDQDEDLEEDLEERLALDYSIGEQLKDKLVPRAVDWFTGAALEFEFEEDEEEEDDDADDDADEDDDVEDDDGEDEDGGSPEEQDDFAEKPEQAPECKQS